MSQWAEFVREATFGWPYVAYLAMVVWALWEVGKDIYGGRR